MRLDFLNVHHYYVFFLPTYGVINKDTIIWIISGLSIMKALGAYMILSAGQLKVLL